MNSYVDLTSLIPVAPEIFLVVLGLCLMLIGAWRGNRSTESIHYGTLLGLMIAGVVAEQLYPAETVYAFENMLRVDAFTQLIKLLMIFATVLVLVITRGWIIHESRAQFEYMLLILFSLVGMMVMVSANNMLTLYMGLELSSLSLYVLAAFDRDNLRSSEAGLKYFVLGALASGMMLFGISLMYGFSGTTSFATMAQWASANAEAIPPAFMVGMVLVLVAFCFKVSAVPFHMWTPDVYEGAPTPVVTYFAVVPKMAALALLIRVLMEPLAALHMYWQPIVILVAGLSMIVGALGALTQTNIKRLLAYSSIGHVGYMLVAVASGTVSGAQAAIIYLALYIFMSVGMFGFVLLMTRGGKPVEEISDLSGLSKQCPKAAALVAILMFSMAGIPPLAGFFGKMYVFLSAVEAGLIPLAVIGVLSSVVAAYYYLKIIKVMYFDEASAGELDKDVSLSVRVALGVCALVTVLFFLKPVPLVMLAEQAASALVM